MAILLIDSDDNGFLNLLVELIKKVKGAKVRYLDSNEKPEDIDDKAFLEEMINSSKSGILSREETDNFLNELKETAQ
jgi:hypothetical protein